MFCSVVDRSLLARLRSKVLYSTTTTGVIIYLEGCDTQFFRRPFSMDKVVVGGK